jgi:hypothetical protein
MRTSRSIAHLLKSAGTAIHNTIDDADLAAAAAGCGYRAERMEEGRALLDDAVLRVNMVAAARGASLEATRGMREARKAMLESYVPLAAAARVLFAPGSGELKSLGLHEARPRTQADLATAAGLLFDRERHPAEVLAVLNAHGFKAADFTAGAETVEAFREAMAEQALFSGDALHATDEQREALRKLRAWYMAYCKIVRVVLRDRPEWLAKLGLTVRIGKSPAQRGAALKAAATRRRNREQRAGTVAAA